MVVVGSGPLMNIDRWHQVECQGLSINQSDFPDGAKLSGERVKSLSNDELLKAVQAQWAIGHAGVCGGKAKSKR